VLGLLVGLTAWQTTTRGFKASLVNDCEREAARSVQPWVPRDVMPRACRCAVTRYQDEISFREKVYLKLVASDDTVRLRLDPTIARCLKSEGLLPELLVAGCVHGARSGEAALGDPEEVCRCILEPLAARMSEADVIAISHNEPSGLKRPDNAEVKRCRDASAERQFEALLTDACGASSAEACACVRRRASAERTVVGLPGIIEDARVVCGAKEGVESTCRAEGETAESCRCTSASMVEVITPNDARDLKRNGWSAPLLQQMHAALAVCKGTAPSSKASLVAGDP
jgi:hypothetical protein